MKASVMRGTALRRLTTLIACAVLAGSCAKPDDGSGIGGNGKAGKAGAGLGRKLEYPVAVAPITLQHVKYSVTAPGTIDAFQQVQITARVAGAVDRVSFTEGEVVKEGQVLASIESARYDIAVGQAKASLAKSQASEHQAEDQLARRQAATVEHLGLIPGEELATFTTAVATAKADVEASTQALRVAELNLHDSSVRAPIAGVVQTRTVQAGQYLQPGAVLATILQRDPLLVRFQVTEQDAPRLKPGMTANLTLRESVHPYTANLTLVGGAADPTTRLVPVAGRIDTTEHQYWLRPGAFCEVEVPIGNARDGIMIPVTAVQPTEQGNVAYVVDKDQAHARTIQLGMHTPTGGVEVTRGLSAGDVLVVRGIDALTDSAPVKVTEKTTIEATLAIDGGAGPVTPASSAAPVGNADGPGAEGDTAANAGAATNAATGAPASAPAGSGRAHHDHAPSSGGTPRATAAPGAPTAAGTAPGSTESAAP